MAQHTSSHHNHSGVSSIQNNAYVEGSLTQVQTHTTTSFLAVEASKAEPTLETRIQECKAAMIATGAPGGIARPSHRGTVSPGTCEWIKDTAEYGDWHEQRHGIRLLGITGGAGKGKTFLSKYLMDELGRASVDSATVLTYFCDNQDSQRKTAHAVLTGLLYQLISLDDDLSNIRDILDAFGVWGRKLFTFKCRKDLCDIFEGILAKFRGRMYVLLDGLDECEDAEQDDSINFLRNNLAAMFKERNRLRNKQCQMVIVSRQLDPPLLFDSEIILERHSQQVDSDIWRYIEDRFPIDNTTTISTQRDPSTADHPNPSDEISRLRDILYRQANGTFLWVALVIDSYTREELKDIVRSEEAVNRLLPRELSPMVNRLLLMACGVRRKYRYISTPEKVAIIAQWTSLSSRPLTAAELRTFTDVSNSDINSCRTFLSLPARDIHDDTKLLLIHQSLKAYLLHPEIPFDPRIGQLLKPYVLAPLQFILNWSHVESVLLMLLISLFIGGQDLVRQLSTSLIVPGAIFGLAVYNDFHIPGLRRVLERLEQSLRLSIFHAEEEQVHESIFLKCLDIMKHGSSSQKALGRDVCGLKSPGKQIHQIDQNVVDDNLQYQNYPCRYWIEHLQQSQSFIRNEGLILEFLESYFLHWLEALSFLGMIPIGIQLVQHLEDIVKAKHGAKLHRFICDMKDFIQFNHDTISEYPLQTYCSALVYTPETSLIRKQYLTNIPQFLRGYPHILEDWTSLPRTFYHGEGVRVAKFSPDGTLVATGSNEGVQLWDMSTVPQKCVKRIMIHSKFPHALAFSPDGRLIVTSWSDNILQLSSTAIGEEMCMRFDVGETNIDRVAFSSDGTLVASVSTSFTVRVFSVKTGKQACKTFKAFNAEKSVRGILLSPNLKRVALCFNKHVKLWAIDENEPRIIHEIYTGIFIHELHGYMFHDDEDAERTNVVAFSADSLSMACIKNGSYPVIIDTQSGKEKYRYKSKTPQWATALTISPNGNLIAFAYLWTLKILNVATGDILSYQTQKIHDFSIVRIIFSPDNKLVAYYSKSSPTLDLTHTKDGLRVWNTETNESRYLGSHKSVSFSPDSKIIISITEHRSIEMLHTSIDNRTSSLSTGYKRSISAVAFANDSAFAASGSMDGTVRLWNIATGTYEDVLDLDGPAEHLSLSPDCTLLASSSKYEILLFDKRTRRVRKLTRHALFIDSMTYSSNNQMLAVISARCIRVWNVTSDEPHFNLSLKHHCQTLAVSSESKIVAFVSNRNQLWLWDLTTGETSILTRHSNTITAVAFSSDGKLLAMASNDKMVRTWDIRTRANTKTFKCSTEALSFSTDGKRICIDDGSICLENGSVTQHAKLDCLTVSESWIMRGEKKVFKISSNFKVTKSVVKDGLVALGFSNGMVQFIEIDRTAEMVI